MPRVLHLHRCEILARRSVERHAAARIQPEVVRIRHTDQSESLPIAILGPIALLWREEALGRGVRSNDEDDLGETGKDACARSVDGLRSGRARAVDARDLRTLEAE